MAVIRSTTAALVLGWSNEAEIAALTKQERDLATRAFAYSEQIRALKRDIDEWNKRCTAYGGNWPCTRLRDAIISSMRDYVRSGPSMRELDVNIDASTEIPCMLHVLQSDELPLYGCASRHC
jgi:uncharacterized protein YPO0396